MAEASWDQAAGIMAAIVNSAPFRKGTLVKPSQFNPFSPPETPIRMSIKSLRPAFKV